MDYLNIDLGPIGQQHLEHGLLSLHYGQVERGLAWGRGCKVGKSKYTELFYEKKKTNSKCCFLLTIVITEVHLPPPGTAF